MYKSFIVILFLILLLFSQCAQPSSNAPDSFKVADGYTLSLVASEPQIKDPVDLKFDEDGSAFVLEMPGYPSEDHQSRVLCLYDDDADGIWERSVVYAEDLELASSIMPYRKGLLVAAPPYLLHLLDVDGDDKVDVRDTLMSGFATGNLQHNFNGLTYGLDNWIYAANGGNNGTPFWWNDKTSELELRGNDIRFKPHDKSLQRIGRSSGGFELSFDDWGRIYETHNLHHISQLVFPSYYIENQELAIPNTLHNISDHEENGLARIFPIGEQESRVNHPEQAGYFSGACGVTYYGGGRLGTLLEQSVWVADVVLNLIHVDKLSTHGSRMKSSRVLQDEDLIASSDRSFRPVNMTVGPDGAMYIIDMYRQVIEHPEWIPDEIEAKMDLTAGMDKGRIYKVTSNKSSPQFDTSQFDKIPTLLDALNSENQWVRMTAHRLLTEDERNDITKELLKGAYDSGNNFGKLHCLWIMHHLEVLDEEILSKAMMHPSAGLKENALKVAESYSNSEQIFQAIVKLLNDSNQRVRMQAALSLSTIEQDLDVKNQGQVLTALFSASTVEMDEWNIASITLAAGDQKLDLLKQILEAGPTDLQQQLVQSIAINIGDDAAKSKSVLEFIESIDIDASKSELIIKGLERHASAIKNTKAFEPLISKLERSASDDLITSLSSYRRALGLKPSASFVALSKQAIKDILQSNGTDNKLKKLKMIALLDYKDKSEVLFKLLSNKEAPSVQQEALMQIGSSKAMDIGYRLVEIWDQLGPQTRRQASDILLYTEMHHDALLSGLENKSINIGEMNFDLERRRQLLWWTDNENTKSRAEALFSDAGVVNRKDVIDQMADAMLLTGSSDQGTVLFESLCGQCHLYGTLGNDVGPALTESSMKSKASLIHDILDPNAACETKYINHKLETTDGQIHIGIVDTETENNLTIKKLGGAVATVNKDKVKSLISLGSSMMPEGLEANLDHQQMADLLSYLLQEEG